MRLVKEAADSVFPWLEFTTDLPENDSTNTVPMLELQVWVTHPPAGIGDPAGITS